MVPPTDPWYEDLTEVDTHDPARAKQLLKEAGHADGFAFTLDTPNYDPHPTAATFLKDEPVSALDVTTRVAVVDLLAELQREQGLTVVMVSHDLAVVASLCERTAVLERGRVVEQGDTAQVLGSPAHAYTRRLLESVPRLPV